MSRVGQYRHRLQRQRLASLGNPVSRGEEAGPKPDATVDCGWGRLIFAHTFSSNRAIVDSLLRETRDQRDIALYVGDPHVLLALAPQQLFLDPSHTYRLWLNRYRSPRLRPRGFVVRLLNSRRDAEALHSLYLKRHMVPPPISFMWGERASRTINYLVACDVSTGELLGGALGVDHAPAFDDPEQGCSLWALAVDPQAVYPGIGQAIVRHMAEFYIARGRSYLDLSVMHDNRQAIRLYERLGFERVQVFAVKRRNVHNEPLFIGEQPEQALNSYARIIVREARRRGIGVRVVDAAAGYFELSCGGRSVVCRESLSELTTAVAMSRCDDKAVTHRVLREAGLDVPRQHAVTDVEAAIEFMDTRGAVVVKPARGEQGRGVTVGISDTESLRAAVAAARCFCEEVLLEEVVRGEDLRVIVIGGAVVAAALRRPPVIVGNGRDSVRRLVDKASRRRAAATDGESTIPLDGETERCIRAAGLELDSVPADGASLAVRKTANLHTGGTIHDVTDKLSLSLRSVACRAAEALSIPVVGLDLMVPDVAGAEYRIIEANERPGLANHEPQPTAERFVDLLFPQTAVTRDGVRS